MKFFLAAHLTQLRQNKHLNFQNLSLNLKNRIQGKMDIRTLQIKVSVSEFRNYKLKSNEIKFTDLVDLISREYARKALFGML